MEIRGFSVFLLCLLIQISVVLGDTNPQDAVALTSLAKQWKNVPSNWIGSDPCGSNWVGISCVNSRIVSIILPSLGLSGTISGDIQSIYELQTLDLSYNLGLTGVLPASIGGLRKLVGLILVGCSFYGEIPAEIGSLSSLVFLSLNSNGFTGQIPPTIGNLTNLYWLDLADNKLSGSIPVSDGNSPGLDQLTNTKHFHFGVNQLSGSIPSKLLSSQMQLIHLLLDNNNISGSIPSTLGLVKSLEVLRLDNNALAGPVPSNLNLLTQLAEMHLSNNKLTGPLPDLTGMIALSFVDMSNNSFDASNVPTWFTSLPSLTTLYLEYSNIGGQIPQALFSSSPMETVRLRNNLFNGTLDIGDQYSSHLKLVDLQNNGITQITLGGGFQNLILIGNPVCNKGNDLPYCKVGQQIVFSYSTPVNCQASLCPEDQSLSPYCYCAYPYKGTLFFRSPSFSDLQNTTYYQLLEKGLKDSFVINQVPVDSISLNNSFVDSNNNVKLSLAVFPSGKTRFNEADVSRLGFILSNQTFKPPKIFGPYYFIGSEYSAVPVLAQSSKSNHLPVIIGVSAGAVVAIIVIAFAIIAIKRKKSREVEKNHTIGSLDITRNSSSSSSIPQLKGARNFSFNEIKKCTNNFSEANDIGGGGFGKVYRGMLVDGQLIAVKRAQQGSKQGVHEFKTEIELLSRVHHKNLVGLVGFCFDQGEQILVYEYVANGTLKDSLSGKSGVHLDWKKRLRVALGAARGLAYLHELANPPIVHRDVKSSNILLDERLNAKISDFGLSKPLGNEPRGHVSSQVKGTLGYLDPEYYMTQELTEKSDVYGFGVVLLEMLTAKKPLEHGRYVVREFRMSTDKKKDLYGLQELVDPALNASGSNSRSLPGFHRFVDLSMKCVEESGIDRPSMSEVVKEIESIVQSSGMNPADSASTSLSYEDKTPIRHPYANDSFDYSGGFSSPRPVPK